MRKQINFFVPDNNQLTKKIIDYFEQSGFKLIVLNDDHLKFGIASTLFEAWKTNPLKWNSEISVYIKDNEIVADFYVDTEAQMNTIEEEKVWNTFIENFQSYLTNGVEINPKIHSTIINNRKSRKAYIFFAFLGAFTGGLIGIIYNKLTNSNSMFSLLLIPMLATLFLTWKINIRKSKNTQ